MCSSDLPRTDFAFKLLAYANVAVGLAGVAVLARLMGLAKFAHPAVVLLFWCLPYTTLAAKFNANAQLLSVWPWAAAALFGSLLYSGWRGLAWSTLLGLCSAAAMLSKYYSGVLLVALFVAASVHRTAAAWYSSPRPWWALAVALPVVQTDLGVSRAEISSAYSTNMVGFFVGGVLVGRLVDRYGIVIASVVSEIGRAHV